jgi:hypothetical protein
VNGFSTRIVFPLGPPAANGTRRRPGSDQHLEFQVADAQPVAVE